MSAGAATAPFEAQEGHPPELTGTALLAGAMASAGLLAYAFHILAARALSPGDYGQIAVLWAALFIGVVVLFRPLEQTMSRAVADRTARGEEAATVVRSIAIMYGLTLLGLAVGSALAWNVIARRLFLGSDFLTAMLVAGVAGYGFQYVLRGLFGGVSWFRGLAACHLADGLIRLGVALPLAAVASRDVAAVALVAAAVAGPLLPLAVGHARLRLVRVGASRVSFQLRAALAFAAPAAVIAGADQLLVNGAPLLVVIEGGEHASRTAGVVFAATMLVRVPVFLFQGVAGSLLPNFTRLNAASQSAQLVATVKRMALVLLAAAAVIVALAAVAGPAAMELLFGPEYRVPAGDLTLLGLGAGCYLASAVVSQALLALDCGGRAATAWAVTAALFLGLYVVGPGDALMRISVAIAIAAAVDTVLLVCAFARRVAL